MTNATENIVLDQFLERLNTYPKDTGRKFMQVYVAGHPKKIEGVILKVQRKFDVPAKKIVRIGKENHGLDLRSRTARELGKNATGYGVLVYEGFSRLVTNDPAAPKLGHIYDQHSGLYDVSKEFGDFILFVLTILSTNAPNYDAMISFALGSQFKDGLVEIDGERSNLYRL